METNNALVGLKNEESIVNYLNKKKFINLSEKWQKHIKVMFPFIEDEDVLYVRKFPNHQAKPDIIIKVRHTNVYVSIKSGRNPSVHMESYFTFIRFLRSLKISDRTLKIITFYHFGKTDKLSNNGKPFAKEELQENFSQYFLEANRELDNRKIIEKVVNRTILVGADSSRTAADYLYYGSTDKGVLLSKEEIYEEVLRERTHENRPIHFGALNYQPSGRSRNSDDFRYARIKWPLLAKMFYEKDN